MNRRCGRPAEATALQWGARGVFEIAQNTVLTVEKKKNGILNALHFEKGLFGLAMARLEECPKCAGRA